SPEHQASKTLEPHPSRPRSLRMVSPTPQASRMFNSRAFRASRLNSLEMAATSNHPSTIHSRWDCNPRQPPVRMPTPPDVARLNTAAPRTPSLLPLSALHSQAPLSQPLCIAFHPNLMMASARRLEMMPSSD